MEPVASPVLRCVAPLMQEYAFPPLVEAFLILDQPRQQLSRWTQVLAPLDDKRAPPLATVNGYFDPIGDQVLLGVSYDELALGSERLAYVVDVALRGGFGMVQPAELSDGDRRRFFGERLARCTVMALHQRSVLGALVELMRRVRDQRPPRAARGSQIAVARGTAPPRPPPIPADAGRRPSRHVIARASSPSLPPPPAPPVEEARQRRAPTVQMDPLEAQRLAAAELSPAASVLAEKTRPNARAPVRSSRERQRTEPYPTTSPLPPGSIYARYLRSGRWVPIRIGALSLRGAALLTSALPRVDDRVEIALAFADLRALVRGSVHKVSTREESARRGAPSFAVAFELDDEVRGHLTALLQAARAANVTLKPPPPRGNRRYPVEWPVCLGTSRGPIRAEALDVSREGMFVRQADRLALDGSLEFSVMLDDRGGPVTGRSRVVRHLDETGARSCGVAPGYGLRIVDMADADRERWSGFLARVERRAERRVLIGASAGRLRELQGGLVAAGYAVAGAADPEALARLASRDERAADACLIDAEWPSPGPTATWSEQLFPTRSVPCVAMRGDVRRAREAIDQVLSIVGRVPPRGADRRLDTWTVVHNVAGSHSLRGPGAA
jgi:hypothetical protein